MNSSNHKSSPVLFAILGISLVLVVISFLIYFQGRDASQAKLGYSRQQDLAAEFVDSKLYTQAVVEYQRLLDFGGLNERKRANINYIMGNIYLEHLRDYENAAARFIRAKLLNPDSDLRDRINKGLVICFERLGRSLEAQRRLERSTDFDQTDAKREGGVVVARIGDREITMLELEEQIEMLPPSMQGQFKNREGKLRFLQSYIGSELLYHMALRRGFDKNQDVLDGISQFKKQMMINKVLSEEIPQDFEISENDVKLYYDAHKEEFEDKNLQEVRPQIQTELKKMKQEEAYNKLVSKLTEAERVRIFDDQL